MTNLLIVESPNKIAKIKSFLDASFVVSASKGHIRNMPKDNLGIDIENNFKPSYIVVAEKKTVVSQLKTLVKNADIVWLASDYDREGEAIAWHISEVLKLEPTKRRRIVFTEITKKAVLNAIANPGDIDMNMFYSQQARMVLDKLIGYLISPMLWKQFSNYKLSAGRVQSVAVRIIAERESEILKFQSSTFYRVSADFKTKNKDNVNDKIIQTILEPDLSTKEEVETLIKLLPLPETIFEISSIKTARSKRHPAPPYITSTLQQDASSKLGMSPETTMKRLQTLYEHGLITYHRTDSLMMANVALDAIETLVKTKFGEVYVNRKQYKTKSQSSQEAHEACRPTDITREIVLGIEKMTSQENRVYQMIWRRTVASQMKPAEIDITTIEISNIPAKSSEDVVTPKPKKSKKTLPATTESQITTKSYIFNTQFEKIIFEGYLAAYAIKKSSSASPEDISDEENNDVETDLRGVKAPPAITEELIKSLKVKDAVNMEDLTALEKATMPPHARFTEANLIKELDRLGIGRPSTYSSIVSKIQERTYVERRTVDAVEKEFIELKIRRPFSISSIKETKKKIKVGGEKNKLFITALGFMINDFLVKEFSQIVDCTFTADIEKMLDDVAKGEKVWNIVVRNVYELLNPVIERLKLSLKSKTDGSSSTSNKTSNNVLGVHPVYGFPIIHLQTKYGLAVCLDHPVKEKKVYSNYTGSITLEKALSLLRIIGIHKEDFIILNKKKGYYLTFQKKHYALPGITDDSVSTITLDAAVDIISGKSLISTSSTNSIDIQINEDIIVKKGPYGYYIKYKNTENIRIPKTYLKSITNISIEQCMKIIEAKHSKPNSGSKFEKKKPIVKPNLKSKSKIIKDEKDVEEDNEADVAVIKISKPRIIKEKKVKVIEVVKEKVVDKKVKAVKAVKGKKELKEKEPKVKTEASSNSHIILDSSENEDND